MNFDYLKSLVDKKEIEFNRSEYSPFMVNRWLVHFPDTIELANLLNGLTLTPEQHYALLYHYLPKKKRFTKWDKKEKQNDSDYTKDELRILEAYKVDYRNNEGGVSKNGRS